MNPRLRLTLWLLVDLVLIAGLFAFIFVDNAVNRGVVYDPGSAPIPYTAGPQLGVNLYIFSSNPTPPPSGAVSNSRPNSAQSGSRWRCR
ncbi:MAG: hypothetical protein HC882_07700 [Acidobacteria bacterium]|nr:hypothetical protein [Acidobacteriota bacterium]